jgi:hypothetical protein
MPLAKPATRFSACVILLLAGLLNTCASNAAAESSAQNYSNDNILADDEVTVVASKEAYYGPLIRVNRGVFAFNNISYRDV